MGFCIGMCHTIYFFDQRRPHIFRSFVVSCVCNHSAFHHSICSLLRYGILAPQKVFNNNPKTKIRIEHCSVDEELSSCSC